jgi:hypothetical protein
MRVFPIHGIILRICDPFQANRIRAKVQSDGRDKCIRMSPWITWITESQPNVVIGEIREVSAGQAFIISIEASYDFTQRMLPAASPDHYSPEALIGQGLQNGHHHYLMNILR